MNYLELLHHSHEHELSDPEHQGISRLEFLADHVFDFTTYDNTISKLFAAKAVEVCRAITQRTTAAYIEDPENYRWYLVMVNMPFFVGRLEWGTSIRGAWWDTYPSQPFGLIGTGFWQGDKPLNKPLKFDSSEWPHFISAVIEFAEPEMRGLPVIARALGERPH